MLKKWLKLKNVKEDIFFNIFSEKPIKSILLKTADMLIIKKC